MLREDLPKAPVCWLELPFPVQKGERTCLRTGHTPTPCPAAQARCWRLPRRNRPCRPRAGNDRRWYCESQRVSQSRVWRVPAWPAGRRLVCFPGASISARRILCWLLVASRTVRVSPSCTPTTFPSSALAGAAIHRAKARSVAWAAFRILIGRKSPVTPGPSF